MILGFVQFIDEHCYKIGCYLMPFASSSARLCVNLIKFYFN